MKVQVQDTVMYKSIHGSVDRELNYFKLQIEDSVH